MEPDKVLTDGRDRLLKATGKAVNLDGVLNEKCQVYSHDEVAHMTNGRLFARFLSRFRFYNPYAELRSGIGYTATGKSIPSLDVAWAHWEHVTLARHYTDSYKHNKSYIRADVGEKKRPTQLYPVWETPVKELMAWGVSVRMYFSTILTLSVFLFVAGLFNLPLLIYFWNFAGDKSGIYTAVKGSAVCDEYEWVACEDCNYGDNAALYPSSRLDGENVLINSCNFNDWQIPGMISYAGSVALIAMFGVAYFWLQPKAEIVFDEEIQTASDYSIKVSNPPKDALDPEEWREYFKPVAAQDVVMVTVAVDNAKLVDTLVKRRKILRKLKKQLNVVDIDMKDDVALAEAVQEMSQYQTRISLPFFPAAAKLHGQLLKYNQQIAALLHHDYNAVAVFVTFETERAQRSCLHALSTGKLNIWRNKVDSEKFNGKELVVAEAANSSSLAMENIGSIFQPDETKDYSILLATSSDSVELEQILRFRGEQVLSVNEATEPNDVRWKDLQVPGRVRGMLFFATTAIMVWFIGWSGFFLTGLERDYPGSPRTAFYIAVTNTLVPKICEFVNALEVHSREGDRNASLYIKVALFRWFNSAICLILIYGFVRTISVQYDLDKNEPSLTKTVYMIIFAEMFTIPIIKLVDIMGNIRKHILAPRALDQEEMNSYFSGAKFELAERYSDATKVIFVALFYSAILPESLFLGAIALMAHYWSGKFCLMRLWRPSADIGPQLARLSRNCFFSTSLIVHVVMSAYFWSGYPYDNVCEVNGAYEACNQDMFRSWIFPPLPRFQPQGQEWMTQSQARIVSLYGYTSIIIVLVAVYSVITQILVPYVKGIFSSTYEPDGEDQRINFSSVKHRDEVHGYVPQVRDNAFPHPLLTCDISNLDTDLIGWFDNQHGFDMHNLVDDARHILGSAPLPPHAFSIVHYWAPSQQ